MIFTNIILNIFDVVAPETTIEIKRQSLPWITPFIKQLIYLRDGARRRYSRSRTDLDRREFIQLRNETQYFYRLEKINYFNNLMMVSSKEKWKGLKRAGLMP